MHTKDKERTKIDKTTFLHLSNFSDLSMAEGAENVVENVQVVIKGDPIPAGKYTVVACDIDTTGKRLIDEVRKHFFFQNGGLVKNLSPTCFFLFILNVDRPNCDILSKGSILAVCYSVNESQSGRTTTSPSSHRDKSLLSHVEGLAHVQNCQDKVGGCCVK